MSSQQSSQILGFISLHRRIVDSAVFASEKRLKVWIWLLLKASYTERFIPISVGRGQQVVKINRGQLIFGRFAAEEALNISGSTIYKILQWLETNEMITTESNSHYSLITINNYNAYQSPSLEKVTADDQPDDSQLMTNEQLSNTYNKEDKVKKVKELNISFDTFWNLYDKKVGKPKSEKKWNSLSDKDRSEIMEYIPKYIDSQPNQRFRKNPEAFLNNESWLDELIRNKPKSTTKPKYHESDY